MKRVGALNSYRMVMIFIHIYFTYWIINLWGLKLKTFLYLTKINFFLNFFYFFFRGIILSYMSYKFNEMPRDSEKYAERKEKMEKMEKFMNTTFKFSFCLSVVVNILYWSLVFFLPALLGDTPTPMTLDLFLHGGNLAVLLVDLIFNMNFNKDNHFLGKSFLINFTILYFFIQYFVYYTMNIEVYPMVSKLSIPQFSMVGVAGYGLFLIGDFAYETFLSSEKAKCI
jgi:hypothetical protein